MLFEFEDLIPADTAITDKRKQKCKLSKGVITRIEIVYPSGCMDITGTGNYLARCAIARHPSKIWPSNPDGYFAADSYTIAFNEHYKILEEPFHALWHTWNLDDTYDHRLRLRILVLPERVLPPYPTLITAINKVSKALEKWFEPEEIEGE